MPKLCVVAVNRPTRSNVSIAHFHYQLVASKSVTVGVTLRELAVAEIDSDLVLKRWKPTDPSRRPGLYAVRCEGARGLYVRMFGTGAITWVFRFKLHGKARQMALGPYPAITMSAARDAARAAYAHVKAGRDPIEMKRTEIAEKTAAAQNERTFADAVEDYMASGRLKALKTDKLREQRRYVLEEYAVPIIGKFRVDEITDEDVQRVLAPIWRKKPATADKVLQYLAGVFTTAIALKYRAAANPASKKVLADWIEHQGTRETGHHPAVAIDDAPLWFASVRERDGMGALALQFVALTAARVGMVRGMTWGEVRDFEKRRIWTIPAARMKASRRTSDRSERLKPFRVPLSDEAVALLKGLEKREGVELVFPAARDGMLSDMTILKAMKSAHAAEVKAGRNGWIDEETKEPGVPHGLRSTFRTWVSERTSYPWEMGEVALAHSVGSKTQKAYDRGDMIERRRAMMNDWADYLTGKASADTTADPLTAAIETLRATGLTAKEILARINGDNVVPMSRGAA